MGPAQPRWKQLASKVRLDLQVYGRDAVRVKLPYLPDVDLGLACRVTGTAAAPRLSGELEGAGAYSDFVLGLYDLFSDVDVRGCYARPRPWHSD